MWARNAETFFGLWLWFSPFIFNYQDDRSLVVNDLICGFLVALFAFLSYVPRFHHSHFLSLFVCAWLVGFGYFSQAEYAFGQNAITVGLILAMFVILPNHASQHPASWERFLDQKKRGAEKGAS
ncbi:MAG: SPW repeat protein [Oligoflexales bacterium]